MSEDPHRYLIAYDIPNDKRRTRLAKKLLSYGDRVQYSVFVADCRQARLVRLRQTIAATIADDEDSVLICDLGPLGSIDQRNFSYLGLSRRVTAPESLII